MFSLLLRIYSLCCIKSDYYLNFFYQKSLKPSFQYEKNIQIFVCVQEIYDVYSTVENSNQMRGYNAVKFLISRDIADFFVLPKIAISILMQNISPFLYLHLIHFPKFDITKTKVLYLFASVFQTKASMIFILDYYRETNLMLLVEPIRVLKFKLSNHSLQSIQTKLEWQLGPNHLFISLLLIFSNFPHLNIIENIIGTPKYEIYFFLFFLILRKQYQHFLYCSP